MLSVETFCDSSINANTYLITNNNHVLIIDPANNFKTLQRFIGDKIVDGVILTHGHYDHLKTLKEVMKLSGVPAEEVKGIGISGQMHG